MKGTPPASWSFKEGIHPDIGDLCVSLLGCELHQVPPGQDPTKKRLKLHRCALPKVRLAVEPEEIEGFPKYGEIMCRFFKTGLLPRTT